MVMMPIGALLLFTMHINFYLGTVLNLAVSLYGLWLLYNGLVEALKANAETSKIVSYVLIAIIVIFSLVGLGAARRTRQFMNEFNNKDVKEMMKDLPKN
jgi:pheromone shutdown protein TraB